MPEVREAQGKGLHCRCWCVRVFAFHVHLNQDNVTVLVVFQDPAASGDAIEGRARSILYAMSQTQFLNSHENGQNSP